MGDPWSLSLLVLLVVVLYFLIIRPQRKRQQEMLRMQNSLTPGTRVMTMTGLFGTVVGIEDEDVVLEVAPGVRTRWVKAAIGRVVTPGDGSTGAEEPPADAAGAQDGDDSSTRQS